MNDKSDFETIITTNNKGWQIKNREELNEFFRKFPNSVFNVSIKKTNAEYRNKLNAKYWGFVVPSIQRELRRHGTVLNKTQTNLFLKKRNPDMNEGEIIKSVSDLDEVGIGNHIDFCVQWSAENMGLDLDI